MIRIKNILYIILMDDPIKIIYKVKNNNRKNQYHVYIFLGNLVDQTIQKLLKNLKI